MSRHDTSNRRIFSALRPEAGSGSIFFRFLKLAALALLISSLFFFLINRGVSSLLEAYFQKTDYMRQENDRRLELFSEYIAENQVDATDLPRLSEWTRGQEVVWMQIYRDHILLFDSQYPYMEANAAYHVEGRYYDWDSYRTLSFADGDAQVFLTGMYTYQFFNYALLAEFSLSFLLFTAIMMAGIYRVMKYIKQLNREVRVLEGGNLDYPITVLGCDELAELARGLDSMRQSIRSQIRQEAELIRLNQSMITSLSHDLRTPLTSLLLYAEILEKELPDQEAARAHLGKIEEKALQIRDMANRILEYSMLKKEKEPGPLRLLSAEEVLLPALSDTAAFLRQQGFQVIFPPDARAPGRIRVNEEDLPRILDNITSNLLKYALKSAPVRLELFSSDSEIGFGFENRKKAPAGHVESNHIGVSNIRSLIGRMGGRLDIREDRSAYRIRIFFCRQ